MTDTWSIHFYKHSSTQFVSNWSITNKNAKPTKYKWIQYQAGWSRNYGMPICSVHIAILNSICYSFTYGYVAHTTEQIIQYYNWSWTANTNHLQCNSSAVSSLKINTDILISWFSTSTTDCLVSSVILSISSLQLYPVRNLAQLLTLSWQLQLDLYYVEVAV